MFTTRIAELNDIDSLIEMMEEFYAESNYSLDHKEAMHSFSTLLSRPTLGNIWIISATKKDVGYVVMTTGFSMEYGGMIADIEDLFVRNPWRRKGAGKELLNVFFDNCHEQNIRAVCVEVAAGNQAAKSLYNNFGLSERTDNRQTHVRNL